MRRKDTRYDGHKRSGCPICGRKGELYRIYPDIYDKSTFISGGSHERIDVLICPTCKKPIDPIGVQDDEG